MLVEPTIHSIQQDNFVVLPDINHSMEIPKNYLLFYTPTWTSWVIWMILGLGLFYSSFSEFVSAHHNSIKNECGAEVLISSFGLGSSPKYLNIYCSHFSSYFQLVKCIWVKLESLSFTIYHLSLLSCVDWTVMPLSASAFAYFPSSDWPSDVRSGMTNTNQIIPLFYRLRSGVAWQYFQLQVNNGE